MKPTHLLQFTVNDYPYFVAAIEYTEVLEYAIQMYLEKENADEGDAK